MTSEMGRISDSASMERKDVEPRFPGDRRFQDNLPVAAALVALQTQDGDAAPVRQCHQPVDGLGRVAGGEVDAHEVHRGGEVLDVAECVAEQWFVPVRDPGSGERLGETLLRKPGPPAVGARPHVDQFLDTALLEPFDEAGDGQALVPDAVDPAHRPNVLVSHDQEVSRCSVPLTVRPLR